MSEENTSNRAPYEFYGKMPLKQAIPLGLQHVLAMFVGNLTPLLIICGACGISGSEEFAHLQVSLLQNAMFVAGVVTLVQLYAIGPIGGKVPIIMGTSSGFIGNRNRCFIDRSVPDFCRSEFFWRREQCKRLWIGGKSAAGAVRTDRNPHGETLDERSYEQLCNPHRDHCRICGSGYYGTAPSEFRDYRGWSRIYKSMGIKLE